MAWSAELAFCTETVNTKVNDLTPANTANRSVCFRLYCDLIHLLLTVRFATTTFGSSGNGNLRNIKQVLHLKKARVTLCYLNVRTYTWSVLAHGVVFCPASQGSAWSRLCWVGSCWETLSCRSGPPPSLRHSSDICNFSTHLRRTQVVWPNVSCLWWHWEYMPSEGTCVSFKRTMWLSPVLIETLKPDAALDGISVASRTRRGQI